MDWQQIFTPLNISIVVGAVVTITGIIAGNIAAVFIAYFKLRALLAQNTKVTVKAKNAAVAAAKAGIENKNELLGQKTDLIEAVKVAKSDAEEVAKNQTAEIKRTIRNGGKTDDNLPALPPDKGT